MRLVLVGNIIEKLFAMLSTLIKTAFRCNETSSCFTCSARCNVTRFTEKSSWCNGTRFSKKSSRCNTTRLILVISSSHHRGAIFPYFIDSSGNKVDKAILLAFFFEYLFLHLSLLEELQLCNNTCNLPLVHYVHLRDVQHEEQKVKLAHSCVLKHYERCNILDYTGFYLFIIKVDMCVPEVLELVLPFLDVF